MPRLRVLVLGPECNPERVSIPLVSYSHAAALAHLHDVTLVALASVEDALKRGNAPFRSIESVKMPVLERVFEWIVRRIFKYNYDTQVLTAFRYPFSIAFECFAWRQLRRRVRGGEFDVVLRLVPITAVLPSPFALFLRKLGVPFVIGPINGGLPWPNGFSQLESQKEWISNLRGLYRYLPFASSTYRYATAIIAASSNTFQEFIAYRDKLFFVPENGIESAICSGPGREEQGARFELMFVGGLVPRKACDLALRGAAPALRSGLARFTVIGDGPERKRLEQLVVTLGVHEAVTFCGWLSHAETLARLRAADVLVFPSVRDFGGGVVFEALAVGAVPIVVDFGGPGDIVRPDVGYKIPLTNESDIVNEIERILTILMDSPILLNDLRRRGMLYARECLTWHAKAESTTRILNWVVGQGPKPNLVPPKSQQLQVTALTQNS